jgi:putative lumazine-binding protein
MPTMKRIALGLGLMFLLSNFGTNAQENKTPGDDASTVRETVRNYIEGYYTGDAQRLAATLHPHYLKQMLHGNIPVREKTGGQMISEVRSNGAVSLPPADRTEQISVLDISGNMASAKLVTPHWIDYMTLSKSTGEWKILSVVQRIDD